MSAQIYARYYASWLFIFGSHCIVQLVKNPPAMWETWVQFLSWEDPLAEGMAIHSSILAWRIPGTIQSMEFKDSDRTSDFQFHISKH